jgi:hypothetical protein
MTEHDAGGSKKVQREAAQLPHHRGRQHRGTTNSELVDAIIEMMKPSRRDIDVFEVLADC